MPPSIGNSGRVTLTELQLSSLAPKPAHFLATESGTSAADPRELRIATVTWIEPTYHRRRRQEALGRRTSIEYQTIMTPPAHQAP
jgi:hypothetical protein